jgi:two-component system, chemotaxis family, chemotaxis protein CheY
MKTCLIVDDSRVVRKVARKILEDLTLVCDEAENGQLALTACQAKMPDMILLDWNMPVMTGIEFLKAMRALPNGGGPKVIFCTTENDMKHIQEALMAGANEYIMKPFDADIIQSKLSQLDIL